MSKFSFHVYGTPDGFDSLYEDKDDELGAFYDGSKENVKLTIHYNINKNEVSYNYLRYNYMSASEPPRSGAFWGISLVCHGCYIFDVNSLFNVFDGLFRQMLKDAKLFRRGEIANDTQAVFLVRKFEDAKSYLERIGNDLIQNVSSWGKDVKTLNFSFSHKLSNNLLQVGFSVVQDDDEAYKCNEKFERLLNEYSWISLSPEYVVDTPEKMNPNDVSKYKKLAKEISGRSVHLLGSLLNSQKTKKEKKSAYELLANYNKQINGAILVLKNYCQHQGDVKDVYELLLGLKETLGGVEFDNQEHESTEANFYSSNNDDRQIEEWKNNIEALEQKMTQLRDDFGTSHADLNQILAQIENLQEKVQDLKRALEQHQKSEQIDNLNEALCNIQLQITDLRKQLNNTSSKSYAKHMKIALGVVLLLLIVIGGWLFVSNSWDNIETYIVSSRIDKKDSIQQIQQKINGYLDNKEFENAFNKNRELENEDKNLYSENLQKIKDDISEYVNLNMTNSEKKKELRKMLKWAGSNGLVNEEEFLAELSSSATDFLSREVLKYYVENTNFVTPWKLCEQAAQSGENVEELKEYLKECFKSYVKIANNISFDVKWEMADSIEEYEKIVKDNFNSFAKGRIDTVNKNQNQEALEELKNYKDKPYACDLKDEISNLAIKPSVKEVKTAERKVILSSDDNGKYEEEKDVPEDNNVGFDIETKKRYVLTFPNKKDAMDVNETLQRNNLLDLKYFDVKLGNGKVAIKLPSLITKSNIIIVTNDKVVITLTIKK